MTTDLDILAAEITAADASGDVDRLIAALNGYAAAAAGRDDADFWYHVDAVGVRRGLVVYDEDGQTWRHATDDERLELATAKATDDEREALRDALALDADDPDRMGAIDLADELLR